MTFMILGSAEAAAAGVPAPSAAGAPSWELGGPPLSPLSAMASAAVTQEGASEKGGSQETPQPAGPGNAECRTRRLVGNGRRVALTGEGTRSWVWAPAQARVGRSAAAVQTLLGRSDIRSRRRFLLPTPPQRPSAGAARGTPGNASGGVTESYLASASSRSGRFASSLLAPELQV